VHLFERDCSAQRRHQKVLEESPASGLDPEQRVKMGAAAVSAAKAAGYQNAGTVEFVAEGGGFWFLEMNTRLQVEHPVTEMITGFDLVEWQLRIAAGESLPATQEQIRFTGHAIEARLYAEDPARDFAPSVGRITALHLPAEQDGVRVDTGVREGDSISVHYDPMIAKLICHGETRAQALGRLRMALDATNIAGVASNLDLLGRIVGHTSFVAGGIDTGFIARHADELLAKSPSPPSEILAFAAVWVLSEEIQSARAAAAASADPYSPWHERDGWWLNSARERLLNFVYNGHDHPVRLSREGQKWRMTADDRAMLVGSVAAARGTAAIELDGVRLSAFVSCTRDEISVRWRGETWHLRLPDPAAAAELDSEADAGLSAPIPGQVTAVYATPGVNAQRGDVLVVLEAMKTVFRLTAPADLEIADVSCKPGDMVEEGQMLVRFVVAEEPD
jgi:3-methylcrotonyl-CoA carboxylase alpha subunit